MSKGTIIKIDYGQPESDVVKKAAAVLKKGGFVVAPTETRYGLLARADSQELLRKLYTLKQRPLTMPTAVFVGDIEQAADFSNVTELARQLSQTFLPGPLTLVLAAHSGVQPPLAADGKIGFRVSSAPIINELLESVGCPLTATSANRSGDIDPETIEEIVGLFGDDVALYLDGGRLDLPTSTVVDCSTETPVIIRAGAIAPEALFRAVRKVNS